MHNYHVSMYTELSSLLLAFYVPQDQFAATPLLAACEHNRLEVARFLIQKGANVNYKAKVFTTPIVFRTITTHCFVVVFSFFFLQSGWSALLDACDEGHTAVVNLLIDSGAKLEIKNNVSVELLVACMGMGS